jgi:hypothetical protein
MPIRARRRCSALRPCKSKRPGGLREGLERTRLGASPDGWRIPMRPLTPAATNIPMSSSTNTATNDFTVSVSVRALVRLTCTSISGGFVPGGSDEATMLRPPSLPGELPTAPGSPCFSEARCPNLKNHSVSQQYFAGYVGDSREVMRASTELDSLVDQPPQSLHIS